MRMRLMMRTLAMSGLLMLVCLPWLQGAASEEKPLDKVPSDLALVPTDALGFLTLRPDEILNEAQLKPMIALWKSTGFQHLSYSRLEGYLGLRFDTIERITFVKTGAEYYSWLIIVRSKKPLRMKSILEKFPRHEEKIAFGKTYYSVGYENTRMYLVDEDILVLGHQSSRDFLRFVVGLKEKPRTHPLGEELKIAGGKHAAVLAGRPEWTLRVYDHYNRPVPIPRDSNRDKDFMPAGDKDAPPKDRRLLKDMKDYEKLHALTEKDLMAKPKLRTTKEIESAPHRREPIAAYYRAHYRVSRFVLTIDGGETIQVNARVHYPSEEMAEDGKVAVKAMLMMIREITVPELAYQYLWADRDNEKTQAALKVYQNYFRKVDFKIEGKTLICSAKARVNWEPGLEHVRAVLPIEQDRENMKLIYVGLISHHHGHGAFCRAICDAKGKPLLSWRVAILPFIGHADLYEQFKLNEPWDSVHNKKLLAKMPSIYAPAVASPTEPLSTTQTPYQLFVGEATAFPSPDSRPNARDRIDPTGTLFFLGEAARLVPWTKPEDIEVTAKAIPKLGGQFPEFTQVLMRSGQVYKIKRGLSKETLWPYITAHGNESDLKLEPLLHK